MARLISSVQLGISRLGIEISDRPNDADLAKWIRSFHRALALQKPELNGYAAELMADVEAYRRAESERKTRIPTESAGIRRNPQKSVNHTVIHPVNVETKKKDTRSAPPAAPPAPPRDRDEIWDAICECFHFKPPHPTKEAKRIGAVARDLLAMGATGKRVRQVYLLAQAAWKDGPPFSPEALVKWWREFEHKAEKKILATESAERERRQKAEEDRIQAEKFHREHGKWPWWYEPETEKKEAT